MKVLCTGGAGYVGSACLRWLLGNGYDAVAFDSLQEGNRAAVPADRLIVADILDQAALTDAIRSHGSDVVMHFAAVASVPDSIRDPDNYWRVNLIGTKNVLDAMNDAGCRRIVFSSTAATYAFDNEMPLTEDSRQLPETPYGTSKLAAEKMIHDYARAYDMGYAILRYFNASGADLDGEFGEDRRCESHLIPLTLAVALGRREKLTIYGSDWDTRDGSCVRDYVHTDDLAQAHELVAKNLEPGARLKYNLGNGAGTTVIEVLRACEQAAGKPIAHGFADARPGDPGTLVTSPQRIIEDLGWQPRYPDITQIVESAWRWHSSYPQGYESKQPAASHD